MRERATLRLDSGGEIRVELERDELDRNEIVVCRTEHQEPPENGGLLSLVDRHLASAAPHPAGTTDRLREADRDRPF
jgi:hypothetical protein